METKFLDARQSDTERIRDLWIKVDQLSSEGMEYRVLVTHFMETLAHTVSMVEERDSDRVTLLLLRTMLSSFENSVERIRDQHKPL